MQSKHDGKVDKLEVLDLQPKQVLADLVVDDGLGDVAPLHRPERQESGIPSDCKHQSALDRHGYLAELTEHVAARLGWHKLKRACQMIQRGVEVAVHMSEVDEEEEH